MIIIKELRFSERSSFAAATGRRSIALVVKSSQFIWPLLACQSGIWKKNQMIDKPIIRYGDWGNIPSAALEPDSSVAYCESEEVVIGGGGTCSSPEYAWIHDSKPIFRGDTLNETTVAINDGWYANCFGRSPNSWVIDKDYPAKSYAICLKK